MTVLIWRCGNWDPGRSPAEFGEHLANALLIGPGDGGSGNMTKIKILGSFKIHNFFSRTKIFSDYYFSRYVESCGATKLMYFRGKVESVEHNIL